MSRPDPLRSLASSTATAAHAPKQIVLPAAACGEGAKKPTFAPDFSADLAAVASRMAGVKGRRGCELAH
jgi:hypothetical protein